MSANENGTATPPAAENARLRKYSSGIIGIEALLSQNTKTAIRAAPASSEQITSPLPQPTDGALTGAQTRANTPSAISGRPTRSSRGRGPAALGEQDRRRDDGRQAGRDVDPEDPLPVDALDHRAAEQRRDRHPET